MEAKKLSRLMKLLGDCLCIGIRFTDESQSLEALPWLRPGIQTLATKMAKAYNERSSIRQSHISTTKNKTTTSTREETSKSGLDREKAPARVNGDKEYR